MEIPVWFKADIVGIINFLKGIVVQFDMQSSVARPFGLQIWVKVIFWYSFFLSKTSVVSKLKHLLFLYFNKSLVYKIPAKVSVSNKLRTLVLFKFICESIRSTFADEWGKLNISITNLESNINFCSWLPHLILDTCIQNFSILFKSKLLVSKYLSSRYSFSKFCLLTSFNICGKCRESSAFELKHSLPWF